MKGRSVTVGLIVPGSLGFMPVVLIMVFAQATAAFGQANRSTLERQHARYVKAQRDSDFPTVLKIVTNDFLLVSPQGKVDRRAIENVAKMPRTQFGGTKEQIDTVRKITIKGSSATIVAGQKFASVYMDRSRVKHQMKTEATFKEKWVYRGGVWKLRRVDIVQHSQTVDGKVVRSNR